MSGQEALDCLDDTNNVYDLVLLDLMMPNISGLDVLLKIRRHDRAEVAAVLFSGLLSLHCLQLI